MTDRYADADLLPTEFMRFERVANPGRKTGIWNVYSRSGGARLGRITWWGPWRQYTFRPEAATVFNRQCLIDLTERVETCNRWHRNILTNARVSA